MTRRLSTLLLPTLLLPTILLPTALPAQPADVPMATWVWDVRHVTVPTNQRQLLAFCKAQRIGTVYVSAYQFTPESSTQYRAFNRLAHRQGLAVHALAGDPRWALARYQRLPLAWVEQILTFNREGQPEERFDGVHTDIEPYLLTRLWMEHPAQLLGGLLDLHEKMAEMIQAHRPFQLGADAPFWYDDDPAYRIQWRGRVLPPSHHLLHLADYLTVLAYRNYAEGTEGIIELSRQEVAYAEPLGKSVVIGQETQPDLFPAYVTYGGTSMDHFWREVGKVIRAFRQKSSFGGLAIHHYESYRELVE